MLSATLTDEQTAYIESHRVARLATVDAAGRPHTVPVCFAVVAGLLYTPLDRKPKRVPVEQLRRVRDLAANPEVCLVVDTYDEDWTRLRFLQLRGTGELILPGEEQLKAIAALRGRYPQYVAMPLEALPVIRITPVRVIEWAWSGRSRYAEATQARLP
ncbi:MAG: TIGR03668 family PPOX class F420-dependent oxidoreductase [Dehalococcoidia bacterium]